MGIFEPDSLEVGATAVGMEAVEREPEGEQGDRDVIELAQHRNDPGTRSTGLMT